MFSAGSVSQPRITTHFLLTPSAGSVSQPIFFFDKTVPSKVRNSRLFAVSQDTRTVSFASKWKTLNGEGKWTGLLDPLDTDLRQYIIHYGELAQVTYDSFNSNKWSRKAGKCYFKEDELFSKVGLHKSSPYKYTATKFFYATSSVDLPNSFFTKSLSREASDKESNWMGYVAVVNDESKELMGRRDIVVAWRGTIESMEWANDFDAHLVSSSAILGQANKDVKIHHGFTSLYTSTDPQSSLNQTCARVQIIEEVKRLVEVYKDEDVSITVVGHSLGAAMATLTASDIVVNKINKPASKPMKPCPVTAIAFASPRVGDKSFVGLCSKYDELRVLRVRNSGDIVPDCPPLGFSDCGVELKIDTSKSPFLKPKKSKADLHNLEGYLHGIAGTQGPRGDFRLVIPRSVGLVNKSMDGLKEEHHVPPCWWIFHNKGMVQLDDGTWQLVED